MKAENNTLADIDVLIQNYDLAFEEDRIQVAVQGYQYCLWLLMESCDTIAIADSSYDEEHRSRILHLFLQLGGCFVIQGYMDDAHKTYAAAFRMRMDRQQYCQASRILYSIGTVMEEYDFDEKAIQYYQSSIRIINLDPENNYEDKMKVYYSLGTCLYVVGRDDEALHAFQLALNFGRDSKVCSQKTLSKMVFRIADFLNDAGFTAEAVQVYETSLELDCHDHNGENPTDVLITIESLSRCADLYEYLLCPKEAIRKADRGISLCVSNSTEKDNPNLFGPLFSRLAFVCGLARLQMREIEMSMASFSSYMRAARHICSDPQAEARLYKDFDTKRVNWIYNERMLLLLADWVDEKFGSSAAA
jgi:tetratricopeptide (TPR) repeat protein